MNTCSAHPILSVVIPTYNSSSTIVGCLNSLLEASKPLFDVIIIDNTSSDNTLQLVQSFSSSFLDITYISEPDKGISDAFNKGIKLSNADYILLLGSDDRIIPASFEYVISHLLGKPDLIDIIFTGIIDPSLGTPHFTDISSIATRNSFIHPGSFVAKNSYLKYGLYSLDYRVGMDYDFFSRAFHHGTNYINIRIPTVIHASCGISSNKKLCFKESFDIRSKYYKALLPFHEIVNYVPSILLNFCKSLMPHV